MVDGSGRCGVVFVSFHSEALVAPLAAAYRAAGHIVRVVDNSGTYDGNEQDVVSPGANIGFGQGCNLGVAALPPEVRVLCFHNPDVEPAVSVLERARAILVSSPGVVAIAPVEMAGGVARSRGYAYPSPLRELVLGVRLRLHGHNDDRPQPPEQYVPPLLKGGAPCSLPGRFPAFAFVVIDRAAFHAVGGFDPNYLLYVEDLDLWHRLQLHQGRCLFDLGSAINHRVGTSSPTSKLQREVLRWVGVEIFAARHSRWGWRSFRAVHRLLAGSYPSSALLEEVNSLWRAGATPLAVGATLRSKIETGELSLAG